MTKVANKVWIVMYTEDSSGAESIKGVFDSEEKAKVFISNYVLSTILDTEYLDLIEIDINKG